MGWQEGFDFEKMAALAKSDPEGFERARRELLEDYIASSPEASRPKLRTLLHLAEAERAVSASPAEAAERATKLASLFTQQSGGVIDNLAVCDNLKQTLLHELAILRMAIPVSRGG